MKLCEDTSKCHELCYLGCPGYSAAFAEAHKELSVKAPDLVEVEDDHA